MNKLLITGCLLATAFAAVAMPNKKELAAAQKLVEDVIAPDVKALNAGRKTVKDVADVQMKLAADAQSEAEKYLLLQSAFKLYSRGEEFDSAAKALTAITRDIKDVPPELITELVDKEFNRDIGLRAPREVEMAERAAQRQRIMAMQKELDKTRSARPSLGGMRRQGLLGGTLRARRLHRQQEAQAATQLQATVDGYTWSYRLNNGNAEIVYEDGGKFSCAVSPAPTGSITIPSALGGAKVTSIGRNAFTGCRGLALVRILEGVTSIGVGAFSGCGGLKSVTIPSTVTSVAYAAFTECAELKQINVDEGNQNYVSVDGVLYSKDRMVLVQCPGGLESVTLLPGLKSIYWHAFNGCNKLKTVEIPPSVTKIDPCAFYHNEGLTSVTIPSSVTSIGHRAFDSCKGLSSVTISPNVTTIASAVFYKCDRLTSVTIPSGVRNIEEWAFGRCDGLSSVAISEGVTNIAELAFLECRRLTSVVIPASVKSMGGSAFGACDELTSVTMRGEKPDSGDKVFDKCAKLKSIHVPANAKSWSGMTEWQGVPLVFDEEAKGVSAMTPVEREFKIGVAPGTVVEVDIGGCPLQFVSCPAGKFRMGFSEKPEVAACREIEISSPFWMTKGRLTMEQLRALGVQEGVTENKEGFACVNEASLMVEKLPQLLNKRFEGRIPEGYVFRLPTEAEFEYVQKAGAVGNDPRLAWGYSDDTDSVPNPWGVQKLFYAGRKDCFLDRVGGGKDVVSRFARNTHWTDLVSINYENQPSRDPVGWCEGNRWAVLRRERNRKLTGRGLYGSTFYFVLAPDESRLNKFIWK